MNIFREDARDRMLLSISDALIQMLKYDDDWKIRKQIIHNLTECNKDLLVVSGIVHGRASGWKDQINSE